MKRLLAYLFIVLGLGLVVNNFAFAIPDIAGSVWKVKGKATFNLIDNPYVIRFFKGGNCQYAPSKELPCKWKQNGKELFWELNNYSRRTVILKGNSFSGTVSNNSGQKWTIKGMAQFIKTQIAKAEPSQTQQVAKKEPKKKVAKAVKTYCLKKDYSRIKSYYGSYNCGSNYLRIKQKEYKQIQEIVQGAYIIEGKFPSTLRKKISDLKLSDKSELTKKEPSQTSNDIIYKALSAGFRVSSQVEKYYMAVSHVSMDDAKKEALKKCRYPITDTNSSCYIYSTQIIENGVDKGTVVLAKKEPKKKVAKAVKKEKKKEKKKGILENLFEKKVVEQEQEEVKVKVKKKDTTGPVIEIAESITVDDSSYALKGKVSDKGSDKIYLKVDGEDIPIKRGKFKIERYSPVDEEIEIVAIDKWGNKSTKVVKVTIDIKEEMVVQKLEPLNPGRAKGKTSGEKVALIIGIENYTEAPKANYANLDAKYFFDYARKAFGAKKQNIKLLINEDATFVKTSKALTLWLRTKVKADQTDLIIFFAGHGLASNDGKELYLLPQDSDPNLLDITALSRTKLFQTIVDLKPKSVTMFLDTCYSGVSRDEQMLLASARPIRIVASDEGKIPNHFTIFSASGLDQISSGFKEAKHGIFSYYLMKGLEGKADANKNKEITNGELLAYMDQNISQKALEQGRQQNPSLSGDPDQILMRY